MHVIISKLSTKNKVVFKTVCMVMVINPSIKAGNGILNTTI